MEDQAPAKWTELDSDEIASIASDELHDNRPNRWHGPKSTWRALTEEERTLWSSMQRLSDQDLSVHLYNAFALKKRGRDPATAQDVTVQTEDGKEAIWAPPKKWTAWPLAEGRLPTEDFVARQPDQDEAFTFRKKETKMPSPDLQDELSAGILRMAKKKFLRRKKRWSAIRPSAEDEQQPNSADEDDDSSSGAEDVKAAMTDDVSDGEFAPGSSTPRRGRKPKPQQAYEPEVSTNDEQSHKLLEPSVRHILSQLDHTLQVLHNTRAAPGYDSDSSSASEESDGQHPQNTNKRPRGRPRKGQGYAQRPRSSKVGRPAKINVPRDGETYDEMLIRVAREGHRRLPKKTNAKPDAAPSKPASVDEEDSDPYGLLETDTDSEGTTTKGKGKGKNTAKGKDTTDDADADADAAFDEWYYASKVFATRRGTKMLGLRDWSDVLGAASLAGFPPGVIDRTAKRCAALFGESMTIRTMHQVPASTGTGVHSIDYVPERIHLSASDADTDGNNASSSSDDEDGQATLLHRRIASRQSSMTPFSQLANSSRSPTPGTPGRPRSRSRSRSRSASAGPSFFCPVANCSRAANGFGRRANLKRHMNLLHPGLAADDASSVMGAARDIDSEDEVLGAVHVDGFLKPVVPSRGWRGEDMMTRKRKKTWGEKKIRDSERDESGSAYEDA